MTKSFVINVSLFFLPFLMFAQSIKGEFSQMPNQTLKLVGFENFDTYVIDSTQTNAKGTFTLSYSANDYGMGYLEANSGKPFILALEKEAPIVKGSNLEAIEEIKLEKGKENQWFLAYATDQPKRDQAMSAWLFLQDKYTKDELFQPHTTAKKAIDKEINYLKEIDASYIADLPKDSYMKWYLPVRKLLSSVGNVAQNRPELIPQTKEELRALDYTDERLYKSGILYDAVFNHIWFIENSSGTLQQVFEDLNTSIDIIAKQLNGNNERFNLVMEKMFEILEERSLFTSSEYLAEKLLAGDDCGCLNLQLQKKLERYGKMAKGQTAPDINFTEFTYYPEDVSVSSLKAIDSDYKLVVFAAGWCPHCVEAMPKITENYKAWRDKGVEVIFVSLDTSAKDFANFAGPLPFVSTTDFKKWDGQAVEDYQVYATPSYFLLNKDLEILLRPKSVEHANTWIEAFLK